MTSPRLPQGQRMDYQKSIPSPPNPRINQLGEGSSPLLKIRCSLGLQQCVDQRRRRMKSSIHHEPRPLRTPSYVLQTNKLPSNLSNHDERDLRNRIEERVALDLYGRHLSTHKSRSKQTLKMCPLSPNEIKGTRSILEAGEVPIRTGPSQIPGSDP